MKHTPGPWIFETWKYRNPEGGNLERVVPVVILSDKELRLAQMDSDEGNENPYTIPLEEATANARLIAAAPDLLEALQEMVGIWEGPRDRAALAFASAIVMARAAIAKAEGTGDKS